MKKHFGKLIFAVLVLAVAVGGQSQHSIKIGWSTYVQGSDTATGFNVWRSTVAGGPYTKITSTLVPVSSLSFNDTSGIPGTKYFYVVTAQDANGFDGAFSTEASATFPLSPAGVQGVTATPQ